MHRKHRVATQTINFHFICVNPRIFFRLTLLHTHTRCNSSVHVLVQRYQIYSRSLRFHFAQVSEEFMSHGWMFIIPNCDLFYSIFVAPLFNALKLNRWWSSFPGRSIFHSEIEMTLKRLEDWWGKICWRRKQAKATSEKHRRCILYNGKGIMASSKY